MKKKIIVDSIAALVSILIGILLLVYPTLGLNDENDIFFIIMCFLAATKFCQYCLFHEKSDYENLYMTIACVLAGTSGMVFNSEKPAMVLALTLIGWVSISAVIKLIKIDYLMDHKNNMWYVKIVGFALFILLGILTSINLYYSISIQSLMLGFFFLCNGIIEISEPLILSLLNKMKLKPIIKKAKRIK